MWPQTHRERRKTPNRAITSYDADLNPNDGLDAAGLDDWQDSDAAGADAAGADASLSTLSTLSLYHNLPDKCLQLSNQSLDFRLGLLFVKA